MDDEDNFEKTSARCTRADRIFLHRLSWHRQEAIELVTFPFFDLIGVHAAP